MSVVDGEIVSYAANLAVQLASTKILCADNFSSRSLYQWGSGKKDVALFLHYDALVRHARYVSAASCTWTHDYGELRYTKRRHCNIRSVHFKLAIELHPMHTPRLIEEYPAKVVSVGENICLMREVCTTRVNKIDAR